MEKLNNKWAALLLKLQKDIAEDIDLKGVLFLIGVQELQMGIKEFTKEEKQDILNTIEDYRKGLLPLVVPVTLIRYQVKKYNIEYLLDQIYLNPHPKELMLRNHV